MQKYIILFSIFIFFSSCIQNSKCIDHSDTSINKEETETTNEIINESAKTIGTRFNPPEGYERVKADTNSFAEYLRTLELKPFGSDVLYYNKSPKINNNIYISVIKMDISSKDLQQCADAMMRLRGEYLYKEKKYDEIHFNFLSDGKPRYFKDYANGDLSYQNFRKYMDYIFSYANTGSLYDELTAVENIKSMEAGDVFIKKGNPYGHAVIVVDMAENKKTSEKVYLLAQSYMPAQEIQILVNPMNKTISPWYELNEETIYTPEWTFEKSDLRRFK